MPTKQKSGLYRAKIKIGVDLQGKDIYKYISGKTKKELEQARQQAIRYYITGEALHDDRLFGEYAAEWFKLRLSPGLSPSSVQSYRTALNKHILPEFGSRKLRAIRPLELQTFIDRFAGASASQITYISATLSKIFKAACADRILTSDPTAHLIKPDATEAEEKTALTPEQRSLIEQACETHEHGLLLSLLYYLGLRGGEARGLQWGDIDWQRQSVRIQRDIDDKDGGRAGKVKTKSSVRDIPIPDKLFARLQAERGLPTMYIISGEISGTAIGKTVFQRIWAHIMFDLGLVIPAENAHYHKSDYRSHCQPIITPHWLRHNYVTMCWEAGIDVYTTSKLVGHSRIETTLRIYTHLTERAQQVAADRLNAVFGDKRCTNVAQTDLIDDFGANKKALKSQ